MSGKSFRELFAEAEKDPAYWTELAILEVTEEIHATMERQGISRADLARRLGTSKAYVTKIFRSQANFTLESLARIARALGSEVRFHLAPKKTVTKWFDVVVPTERGSAQLSASTTFSAPVAKRAEKWASAPPPAYATRMDDSSEIREGSDGDASAAA